MPYYIVFVDGRGNPNQRGPFITELRAQEKLDEMDVEGEIYRLPTRDPDTATRMLKDKRLDAYGVDEGTRRFSHK